MKPKKMTINVISNNAQETFEKAFIIGKKLREGDVLALSGELGSGKTCFTAGIARGLGVSEKYQITSPTFTIINEYPAVHKLYHFDVYRLCGYSELEDLGYDEYLSLKGVIIIEWAEKIVKLLPEGTIFINFEYLDETKRNITINCSESRLEELENCLKNGG
jgi:tRNA threonylcarbamoyladenosine biosynthesis protein TsaE